LAVYEGEEACAALSPATLCQVYLRLGSAYGYTGNPPLGITYAKQALALAEQTDSLSIVSVKLLRLYRAMGETGLARLQYGEALEAVRFTGSQLLLAHAFLGGGTLGLAEGDLISARQDFERALENLGAQPALLLRGHLEMNGAVLAILQGRPRAGRGGAGVGWERAQE
jgi:tetratricopeptide (TPR) repeat protein